VLVKSREHVRPIPGVRNADILVRLETDRRRLVGYAVVLRVFEAGAFLSVRLFDYVPAHGEHHMHRYTREGAKRQPPEVLNYASIQEGFNAAVQQIRATASEMIDSWQRQRVQK
jgi:hypothetical protein